MSESSTFISQVGYRTFESWEKAEMYFLTALEEFKNNPNEFGSKPALYKCLEPCEFPPPTMGGL